MKLEKILDAVKIIVFTTILIALSSASFSQPFITTWKTDNPGVSANNQITVPTAGGGYNYNIYWEQVGNAAVNGTLSNQTGSATITFPSVGTYRVEISGSFPRIFFNSGDSQKILTVEQWGSIAWSSMNGAFYGCTNLTIPAADVPNLSGVTNMDGMFSGATSFNQPIGNWNVGSVTDMDGMFGNATSFNQPIDNWDVSNVTSMSVMFGGATSFNQPISNWDVGNVTNMSGMFSEATSFNQPIDNWDVGNVTNMYNMFLEATTFNQPIGNWDVSNVTNMHFMFGNATSFNQPIGNWNVSNVTDMSGMFLLATSFNQPISNWNVSSVTDMNLMFYNTGAFNQPIGNWDVGNVTNMSGMFARATSFNQPVGNWNVGSVINMSGMFGYSPSFNQPIVNWDVSKVTNMTSMFGNATSFNQPISNWNVSNVTDMSGMFLQAISFNQSIGNWNVGNVTSMIDMISNSGLSASSYDATLIGWAAQPLQPNVALGATGRTYCAAATARTSLISSHNWTITGDVYGCIQAVVSVTVGSVDHINGSTVAFNSTLVGSSIDLNFVIGNTGNVPLAISDITTSGDFALTSSTPTSIAVGSTNTMGVRFSPTFAGTHTGTFIINSDASVPVFIINLSGLGQQIPTAIVEIKVNGTAKPTGSTVAFNPTLVGSSTDIDFVIRNSGTAPLAISDIVTSGDFALTTSPPALIAVGATSTIGVRFSPALAGTRTGTFIISSDASVPVFTINLSGVGQVPIAIIEIGSDGAAKPSGSDIAFSVVGIGEDQLKQIDIINMGNATLVITDIQLSGDYTLESPIPSPIDPGNNTTLSIKFAPTDLGSRVGTLTISSNGDIPIFVINLSGEGEAEPEVYNVVTTRQNGKHDFLNIKNITFFPQNKMTIFDRWGNKVFERNGYDNVQVVFTGISDDNKQLPDGTYFYVLDKNNGDKPKNGFIYLRR